MFPAVVNALARYDDADLQKGENILDSWSLMHACFAKSDALEIGATHVQLKDGRTLGANSRRPPHSLTPGRSPNPRRWFSRWQSAPGRGSFASGRCNSFNASTAHTQSRSKTSSACSSTKMLTSSNLVLSCSNLPASWRRCPFPPGSGFCKQKTKTPSNVFAIAFAKHVSTDRLDLAQCVELASVRPVPVARLGQKYLQGRTITLGCRARADFAAGERQMLRYRRRTHGLGTQVPRHERKLHVRSGHPIFR